MFELIDNVTLPWLHFDNLTMQLFGRSEDPAHIGTSWQVAVKCFDEFSESRPLSELSGVTLFVLLDNRAPYALGESGSVPRSVHEVQLARYFDLSLPGFWIREEDAGDRLNFSALVLQGATDLFPLASVFPEEQLQFDNHTLRFNGTVTDYTLLGEHVINVYFTDNWQQETQPDQLIQLILRVYNHEPTCLNHSNSTYEVHIGQNATIPLPIRDCVDADSDTISFSVSYFNETAPAAPLSLDDEWVKQWITFDVQTQ